MLNIDTDDRSELTTSIMSELDCWGLTADELIELLQLPSGTPKRALRKYRESVCFPQDSAVDERLEHLVGIINALRTSYPHNRNMASFWMKQANKRFENKSPIAFIRAQGLEALVTIRKHLDCSYMPN